MLGYMETDMDGYCCIFVLFSDQNLLPLISFCLFFQALPFAVLAGFCEALSL